VKRLAPCVSLLIAGCAGNPSALDPAGPAAHAISRLTWLLVIVCGAIYLLVLIVFAIAVRQGKRRREAEIARGELPMPDDRARVRLITAALIASGVVLSVFVGASYATDRVLLSLERQASVEITLTAHQWWWEIRYDDPTPSRMVLTANEMHLPIGEPVKLTLVSQDVIHSVWLPNLAGKRDVIPGRDNTLWLTASEAGEWRGRCAEFCGYQHAHMELMVVVEPRDAFNRWRDGQAAPAKPPDRPDVRHGQQVFENGPCILCHVIRGTGATGYSATAPDLTHLKSRRTIAAGTLPNTKGHLAGWIADPQTHKPGVRMPANLLSPQEFQDLLAYLETLR
jgi:cytochrome c oxidase subunit II